MDYYALVDFVTELGYRLAMCGAETFRVEESINRIMEAYGIPSEVFAIPNCLTVSIETPAGKPMTRMRRIGYHGNDLDAVEKFSNLGRRVCAQKPDPTELVQWLKETDASRVSYSLPMYMVGNFLGAFGYSVFFGGSWLDGILAGLCGLLVGAVNNAMDSLKANQFFRTIIAAFLMSVVAYGLGAAGFIKNVDAVVIGSLMLLVPGLLFTNAMRDIIYGDTNSGVNRIVQVFLIAAAIALGTAAAWNLALRLWGAPVNILLPSYSFLMISLACVIGCVGFAILFNIHGPGGLLCALGGFLAWCVYYYVLNVTGDDIFGYFCGAVVSAIYAEIMARIRKYPAISYLVVSIFPLIPGAGVYYTMNFAVRGDMVSFSQQGTHTIAIAGIMAVGILMVSTVFRLWSVWKMKHAQKKCL